MSAHACELRMCGFVTEVFSRTTIVWPVSSTLKTEDLVLQAFDMAVGNSYRGSNYVSLTYTKRTVELGRTPSTGSKGDS